METNRIAFDQEGRIRPAAVVLVGLVLSALALAINTLISGAVPPALGAPDEVALFGAVKVVLATVPAALGNTLGIYMSYRERDPRADLKFLAPAAGFFVVFISIPVWGLISGGTTTAFAVASALNIVAVAVPVLLILRPQTAPDALRELRAEPAAE